MRKGAILTFALSAAFFLALTAAGQPPGGDPKGDKGGPRGKGGPGGFGMRPGQVLPGFLQDRLKLSDEQKEQIAALQKEVDAKIAKILTDEQNAELKKIREQGPGGRPGGPGGGPPQKGPPDKEKN